MQFTYIMVKFVNVEYISFTRVFVHNVWQLASFSDDSRM